MSDADSAHGTHSYYDWQISTLMLAYDVVEPIGRTDGESMADRQKQCELEVRDIALASIPDDYRRDEQLEFPPEIVMAMTRATLKRAAMIVGI